MVPNDNRDNTEKTSRIVASIIKGIGICIKYISEIGAVIVALLASILGFLNIWDIQVLLSVFSALFTFLLVYFLIQNKNTKALQESISKSFDDLRKIIEPINNPSFDAIFFDANESKEKRIISDAKTTLTLLQETGNLIIEQNKPNIIEFLNQGGRLRIVVCSTTERITQFLAMRNSDLLNPSDFDLRSANFLQQINSICNRDPIRMKEQITVRQSLYPIAITAVLSDESDKKSLLVRYADFKSPYNEKIDLFIDGLKDPRFFNYYADQINKYYLYSYKKILVTGVPHVGKTTLFRELIRKVENSASQDCFYYLYAEEILKDNERVGYQMRSSVTSTPIQFATRNDKLLDMPYDISIDVIDSFAEEISANANKILILDELGIMQFKSEKFQNVITSVVKRNDTTLFATITQDTSSSNDLKLISNNIFCDRFVLTRDNHDEIMNTLTNELFASVALYSTI